MSNLSHTAIHEAAHAVIGRILGMNCGSVSVVADDDSTGHSICADPWATMHSWDRRGHFRDARSVFVGRVLTYMAGAEAEVAILGICAGGDGDDREQISEMLETREIGAVDDNRPRLEARLRRAARMLVHRHQRAIEQLATALTALGTIQDDAEIRIAAGMPPANQDFDYWATIQSEPSGPATDVVEMMDAAIEEHEKKRR